MDATGLRTTALTEQRPPTCFLGCAAFARPSRIKADETTQLKKLTFVMDACRKSGLNKFSLQSR